MEPTLKELEEMYDSLLSYNEDIRKHVDKLIGERNTLDLENQALSFRKRETLDAISKLDAQFKHLGEIYEKVRKAKEDKMTNLRERVDELKLNMALGQQQLVKLLRGDYGPDFEVKAECQCFAQKLSDSLLNDNAKVNMDVKPVIVRAGRVVDELATGCTAPVGSVGLLEVKMNLSVFGNSEPEPEGAACKGSSHGRVLIRDFRHLHQLKCYFADKRNTKKPANSLKKSDKKTFKAAISQFCDSALGDLTKTFHDLKSEMSITMDQIMEQFEICLDCELKIRTKIAVLQRIRYVLTKFGKKYPVDISSKKSGFFEKLFGRRNETAQLEAARLEELEVAKEMLRIERLRSPYLEACLKAAEARKQVGQQTSSQLQTHIKLLNAVVAEEKLLIKINAVIFREISKKQDAKILKIKKAVHRLEGKIELYYFASRYIYSGIKLRKEVACKDESRDAGSAIESRIHV